MYKPFIVSLLCLFVTTLQAQDTPPKYEFRGFWICTKNNLDWPSSHKISTEEKKAELIAILDRQQANGLNAVFFQVRAAADAFYKSDFEPWSQWLTGKQGQAPDPYFDPLAFIVEEGHKRNMEVHAWFNLFRGVSHDRFSDIHKDHVSKKNASWFYKFENSMLFDPGIPEVRHYINQLVTDVVDRYDVDGIHLDDYFYPQETHDKHKNIDDKKTFKRYGDEFKDIEDWRRFNINMLIKGLNDSIKAHKPYVKFGISPFPIWRHEHKDKDGSMTQRAQTSYDGLYADTRKWIKYGWVDYMAPQLYWSTMHKNANYNHLLNWWDANAFDRQVYIGHAYYKLSEEGDFMHDYPEELIYQIEAARKKKNIVGSAYYRAASFKGNPKHMEDTLRAKIYPTPAIVPPMPWIDSIAPAGPVRVWLDFKEENFARIQWEGAGDEDHRFVVYKFNKQSTFGLNDPRNIFEITYFSEIEDEDAKPGDYYLITTLDRLNNESAEFVGIRID